MKKIFLFSLIFIANNLTGQSFPGKEKVSVYLLIGQSNMAGRGKVEEIDSTTHANIWMLNKEENWVPAREPLAFDKPAVVGVGPGYAFAREITNADPSSTICLVPSAIGGSKIDLWKPGAYDSVTKTHPYDDAIRRIKKALQSGELKGIIWHQGESDANVALSASYENKLRELIQRFRAELNAPAVPFILGEIGDFKPGENKYIPVINSIIRTVAGTTKNAALAESKGLTHKGDFTHFDAASARELGKRYAAAFLAVKKMQ
jgi:hypothetical protein